MVLSLLENLKAKQSGTISWDEYLDNLLARCTEKQDSDAREGPKTRWRDPFGHIVWMWCSKIHPIPSEDVRTLKAVFEAYRHGGREDVKFRLRALDENDVKIPKQGVQGLKKSLALLACQERRADVLKYCLDLGGFPIQLCLLEAANRVGKEQDPETYKVVWGSSEIQRLRDAVARGDVVDEDRRNNPAVIFDEGGALPVKW